MFEFIAAKHVSTHNAWKTIFSVQMFCVMKLKNRDTGEPHKRIENTCNKTQSIFWRNGGEIRGAHARYGQKADEHGI